MRFDAITGLKPVFGPRPRSIRGQSFTPGTGTLFLFDCTAGQTGEFQNREIIIVLILDLQQQLIHKVNVFFCPNQGSYPLIDIYCHNFAIWELASLASSELEKEESAGPASKGLTPD